MTEPSGVLILDKPTGFTSHDCVNKVRRFYNTKKVGHTGTLDPDASGVLVVLVGLGITTDTEDTTGKVLTESSEIPDRERVNSVCESFVGDIMQVPPMYSALKRDGQKLVDLARRGITVEREARPITIHSLDALPTDRPDEYMLSVRCSKGTYIRTLCADIGASLGCGGAMCSLRRLASGGFRIEDAVTLGGLDKLDYDERVGLLRPTESLFSDIPAVKLPPFFEKLARSGCEIYEKKIGVGYPVGTRVRMYGADGFFAVGEVGDYPDGDAIKAVKLFVL